MMSQLGLMLTYEMNDVFILKLKVIYLTNAEFLNKKADISVRFITFVTASNISTPPRIACFKLFQLFNH